MKRTKLPSHSPSWHSTETPIDVFELEAPPLSPQRLPASPSSAFLELLIQSVDIFGKTTTSGPKARIERHPATRFRVLPCITR